MNRSLKPLYLNPGKPTQVMLDGRGLRVRIRQEADRLFPLARLSRITVSGQVDWATDALLACAQAGIPVYFVRRDGTLCASVTGESPRENWLQLQAVLSDFLELPDSHERYQAWVRASDRLARLKCRDQMKLNGCTAGKAAFEDSLHQQANKYARCADLKRLDAQIRTLIKIHLGQQLQALHIDTDAVDLLLHDIRLADDLTGIIWWTQQQAKLAWIRAAYNRQRKQHAGLARLDWGHSIGFFENRREMLNSECHALLRDFFTFLGDMVRNHGLQ